ncbi:MAG: transporter substrate-binding domain-containing protein [Solidesulfovibrio sp. DCME]|uniref:transporter substrate-binding domain-containing protein n=1 Tax=Solidesulfovibrio sp. DCME TaxID=3447380 RepID=UPI003D0C9761
MRGVAVRMAVWCLLGVMWLGAGAGRALAAAEAGPAPGQGKLRVGVVVAPPFVEKSAKGLYQGVAISLWEDIARDAGWLWEVREYDLEDLIEALRAGKVDVGVSALSITPEREGEMDFSQPFFYTGLGIAVPAKHSFAFIDWLVQRVFTAQVLGYVGSLLALLLLVGAVVWAIEHRRNPEHFRPGRRGIGDGMWWSAVTMTSVGYGDATPKTLVGRAVALVWMFASVALLASFTAGMTSLLTLDSLGGKVHGPDDLHRVRTGVVADSSAAEELMNNHVGVSTYPNLEKGLLALVGGELDAFVHDKPLLHYSELHGYTGRIRVLPGFFDPQLYGFAFPQGSQLRKSVNVALLRRMEDQQYRLRLFGPYLGKGAVH